MDRELWDRITDIFDAALDRPVSERQSYLDRACAGYPTLLSRVSHLLEEFDRAGSFLESPLSITVHTLTRGELLADRYRIEGLLGHGGMGEVYRAHDELLNEPIALKTLRREFGDDHAYVRRFRREVQVARKVTHPRVCRIFEVGIHTRHEGGPVHFFTMQLLEGETLAARLRRAGPFPPDAAYQLAVHMADGLDAAHRVGIAHRDFKSANVMLCDGGAVITDFGLARLSVSRPPAADETITALGQVAGTIAYMSPEQFAGGPVTTASDIYSLGVVLFELITGRLPFNDENIIRTAMQRSASSSPDVRALAPELDARWVAAITRCLQRVPADRFSSAGSVASAVAPVWRPPMAYWTRRQWIKVAAVTGTAAASVAIIPAALRFRNQTLLLPEGAQSLLVPIENTTKDPSLDGITELFRHQLSQSVRLSLLDRNSIASGLSLIGAPENTTDPSLLRDAAYRVNAVLFIFGGVSKVGTDYVLHTTLELRGNRPDNPQFKASESFLAADPQALMGAVRRAVLWIREVAGEPAASIASFDRLPAEATTSSWEALKYYAQAEQSYMSNRWRSAEVQFRAALQEDPEFTLAAMRLADLLMSQNYHVSGITMWRRAIAMLDERPLTRAEELFGRGMFAYDTGEYEASEQYFRTWSAESPENWRAAYYRWAQLCLNGHAGEALDVLRSLQPLRPDYVDLYTSMISCHLVLGQTNEARALIPTVRRLSPPDRRERADLREAGIQFREGDCVGSLETLRRVQRSTYRRGAAAAMLDEGLLLIDASEPSAAAVNIERFLRAGSHAETASDESSLRLVQAWAEVQSRDYAAAIEHASVALSTESGALATALGGTIFARAGDRTRAQDALQRTANLQDLRAYRLARHRILGELAWAEDRRDDAVAELRAAAALEPSVAHRQYLIEKLPQGSPERLALALKAVRVPWLRLRSPLMHHIDAMRIAVADVNAAGRVESFSRRFAESLAKLTAVI